MTETEAKGKPAVRSERLLDVCCCGAPATGHDGDGNPRCCATCCFHPLGCRCQYGDPPDTPNEPYVPHTWPPKRRDPSNVQDQRRAENPRRTEEQ